MLKTLAELELKIENWTCRLSCNSDMPTKHLKECIFQFLKYIGSIEDAAKAQQEAQNQVEVPPEEQTPSEEVREEPCQTQS